MSNNQDIHKKQFYSKLKTTKKINSRLINREDLEIIIIIIIIINLLKVDDKKNLQAVNLLQ